MFVCVVNGMEIDRRGGRSKVEKGGCIFVVGVEDCKVDVVV